VNVTPLGSAPVSSNVGLGNPVVVTVNDPTELARNVALFALVIAGALLTTMPLCVPVMEAVTASVAVSDWVPPVLNVALKVCVPLSPATNVQFNGRVAAPSELVKWTVPV
jgi:hypothetical protein